MKVVVIGGSGLIGSKVVKLLGDHGHGAVPASPESGVNTITGEGLDEGFAGADVVIDVSNSPSLADDDVMAFFTTSTRNQIKAERNAGVKHHVALSIVGADRAPDSGYLRAKVAQERLIKESGVPYSVVRATQFFEFAPAIADSATVGNEVHLPPVGFQPIASDDVAKALVFVAMDAPLNGTKEIAGPQRFRFDRFIADGLARLGDPRPVIADPAAPYFGQILDEDTIVPAGDATPIGATSYDEWAVLSAQR